MLQTVLEKTKTLDNIVQQRTGGRKDILTELVQAMSQMTQSSVYVVTKKGQVRAHQIIMGIEPIYVQQAQDSEDFFVDEQDFEWLWNFNRQEVNFHSAEGFCLTIVPVFSTGDRLAAWIFAREEDKYSADDLVLFEFVAAITALELSRQSNEQLEKEIRKRAAVELAIDVLSYSELEAVKRIFANFDGEEGFVVASKLAEEHGLTRSVIVNALRKLESAGVIDSRSLGVKGTYIRILNEYFLVKLSDGIKQMQAR